MQKAGGLRRVRFQTHYAKRSHLRAEGEEIIAFKEKQRLHTEPISSQLKSVTGRIVHRNRKHAVAMRQYGAHAAALDRLD